MGITEGTLCRFQNYQLAQKGYTMWQINNFNLEGLIIFNIVLLAFLKVSPILDKKLQEKNEYLELGRIKIPLIPNFTEITHSTLFLINFTSLFVFYVVPYVT